jgi:hypothetical protein
MKGFIYLIEIAVAAILMTIVLTVFFSIRIKQDWQRSDLISTGNNILNSMKNENDSLFNILSENLTDIESSKPQNVKYGLQVRGSSKSNIYVGCYSGCDYIEDLLSPFFNYGSIFVNGRWINFTVKPFDINVDIPPYDAIVLVNYTNYSHPVIKSRLSSYLNSGGVVVGINETLNNSDNGLNNTFNLTASSTSSSSIANFTFYNSSRDDIAKYFLGIGMDAISDWYIWEEQWHIDYWSSNKINITNVSNPTINRTNLVEGSVFNLTFSNGNKYFFKVKNLWYLYRVDFQILNKTFPFKDFSEKNVTSINTIIGNLTVSPNDAALTLNNSAVWMSSFPKSDEYKALLRAAILSRLDTWTPKGVYTTREKTTVSSFASLCCDMPETAELYLTLWYEI